MEFLTAVVLVLLRFTIW